MSYSDVSLFLKPHFNLRAMTPNIWKNEAEYVNLHSTCWILIHWCELESMKEVKWSFMSSAILSNPKFAPLH